MNTVLLVDDEPDLRDILAFEFQKRGCEVLQAQNGREAFGLMKNKKVDVVVTDIRMPGGDGVELLDNAKNMAVEQPIVLLTGFSDLTLEDAYQKGAEAVFTKPFNRKALAQAALHLTQSLEQRWSQKPEAQPVALLELTFPSFEAAEAAKRLLVGRGGVFLAFQGQDVKTDSLVQLKISFQGGGLKELNALASIRWQRGVGNSGFQAGLGLEFVYVPQEKERQFLINHIKQKATKCYIPKG